MNEITPRFCVAVTASGHTTTEEHGLDARELFLHRQLYCATKPVVALAYLALLEQHGFDCTRTNIALDGTLGEGDGIPVLDLLAHRTNLAQPDYWFAMAMPLRMHDELFEQFARDQRAAATDRRVQYSECLTWWLLGRSADRLLGERFDYHLTTSLAALLGERRIMLVCDPVLAAHPYEGLSTCFLDDGHDTVPMLHGVARRARVLTSSHFGGFGEAYALGDWYRALLHAIDGDRSEPGASELFPTKAVLDRLRDRHLTDEDGVKRSYELGFMVNLHENGFRDQLSAEVIGHHGAGGSLFAFADPKRNRVVVAVADTFHQTIERRNAQLRAAARAAMRELVTT